MATDPWPFGPRIWLQQLDEITVVDGKLNGVARIRAEGVLPGAATFDVPFTAPTLDAAASEISVRLQRLIHAIAALVDANEARLGLGSGAGSS